MMNDCLTQYYRCPEQQVLIAPIRPFSAAQGYFRFGQALCYGSLCDHQGSPLPTGPLYDAAHDVELKDGTVHLPFDPSQVAHNLRSEIYSADWRDSEPLSVLARMYYFIRPILPVKVRAQLQKLHLRDWRKMPFPRWPVDCSVDTLFEQLMLFSAKTNGEPIPFIWFWPEGAPSCAIMTHDVETELGRDFCGKLMDLDDSFGIKASFQVVPEQRYPVSSEFLNSIRERGFEIVVHDLNHDGHLYRDRKQFIDRAARINAYREQYGAEGFRAGVLYRKQLWYDALRFSYDMSVPNVARLDPQRGGCCTVMPYFLDDILELPVTTTQDYTLFNILNDYSIDLWRQQIGLIMEKHGLISFIVHPDYIVASRERTIYEKLLSHLVQLREEKGIWITKPGEVNRWWRQRSEMTLVQRNDVWEIEGKGKERARIAYAREEQGQLVITLQDGNGASVTELSEARQRS